MVFPGHPLKGPRPLTHEIMPTGRQLSPPRAICGSVSLLSASKSLTLRCRAKVKIPVHCLTQIATGCTEAPQADLRLDVGHLLRRTCHQQIMQMLGCRSINFNTICHLSLGSGTTFILALAFRGSEADGKVLRCWSRCSTS